MGQISPTCLPGAFRSTAQRCTRTLCRTGRWLRVLSVRHSCVQQHGQGLCWKALLTPMKCPAVRTASRQPMLAQPEACLARKPSRVLETDTILLHSAWPHTNATTAGQSAQLAPARHQESVVLPWDVQPQCKHAGQAPWACERAHGCVGSATPGHCKRGGS